MKTVAIIQARMGSSRLPGKILKDLMGKTVLQHVIERTQQASSLDDIVIATTTMGQDDVVVREAVKCGVKYFRGSEDDVLSRYYLAAKENNADVVVRITSDCPLIDPVIIDEVVNFLKKHKQYPIITNALNDLNQRTYPRGLDTEVFYFTHLQQAFEQARESYQREHVTPYIYENSAPVYYYKNKQDYSKYRWTLDTIEDFELIKKIYEYLYKGKHDFFFAEILNLFEKNPDLVKINEHIEQKKLKNQ